MPSVFVRNGAASVHFVVMLLDVFGAREEGVIVGFEFARKLGVEVGLERSVGGLIDQVVLLIGISFVVEKQPRAGEIAHVGIARGAEAAVFLSTDAALEFSEWRDAREHGSAVAGIRAAA